MGNGEREQQGRAAATPARRVLGFLRRGRRRKVLGWLILGALAAGAAGVAVIYHLQPRRGEAPAVVPQALPAGARQGLAGFSFTHYEGRRPVFVIRAKRSVDYKNGEGTSLDGVEVEMFGRTGAGHNLLEAQSCRYHSTSGDFTCRGQVRIELDAPPGAVNLPVPAPAALGFRSPQPVFLDTIGISYSQKTAMITSRARVRWRYGTASGTATGLSYSTGDGQLSLDRDVTATLPVEAYRSRHAPGPAVLRLAASHLRYLKTEGRIELTGPVRLVEGLREVTADHAVVQLDSQDRVRSASFDGAVQASDRTPDSPLIAQAAALEARFNASTGHLETLEARGEVKARSGPGPRAGTVQFTADRARVSFVGAHFHPSEGFVWGHVHVNVEPAALPAAASAAANRNSLRREDLEAAELDIAFRPANGAFEHAQTAGPGKLVLIPSSAREGRRVATAGQFLMSFDGLGRLESLRGTAPTRLVFELPPGAAAGSPIPESRADSLEAEIDPATGLLERLEQSGHFRLLDGSRQATAERAVYSAQGDAVTLSGKPGILDPDTRIRADRFLVHVATRTAEGFGHVTSSHLGPWSEEVSASPARTPAPARVAAVEDTAGAGAIPGQHSLQSPLNVIADRVIADRNQQYVRYEGHVRAWQGPDVLESPSLDIYRSERRIVSGAGVVTSDLAPPAPVERAGARSAAAEAAASSRSGAEQPVTVRADRLEYFDPGRKASYRGHVRLDASGATLEADRLTVYFTTGAPPERSQIDHAVADGHVILLEPGRRAAAEHGEYYAAAGKVVMTGGPPALYDAQEGFATGRSLTFYIHGDTLLVDGGSGIRALSKHPFSR